MTQESCHLGSDKGRTGGVGVGVGQEAVFLAATEQEAGPTSPGPGGASLYTVGLPPLCGHRGRRSRARPSGHGVTRIRSTSKITERQEVALVTPSSGHLGQALQEAGPALGRRAGESARAPPTSPNIALQGPLALGTEARPPSLFYEVLRRRGSQGGTDYALTPQAQKTKGVSGPPAARGRSVPCLESCRPAGSLALQVPQQDLHEVEGGEADAHGDGALEPVHAQALVEATHGALLPHDGTQRVHDGGVRVTHDPSRLHAPPHHVQRVRGRLPDEAGTGPKYHALEGVGLRAAAVLCGQGTEGPRKHVAGGRHAPGAESAPHLPLTLLHCFGSRPPGSPGPSRPGLLTSLPFLLRRKVFKKGEMHK